MEDEPLRHLPKYEIDTSAKTGQGKDLVDLAEVLSELDDLVFAARIKATRESLQRLVFRGLTELKPKFDSPLIAHFHAADFIQVIDRCTVLGVCIHGVEIFDARGRNVDIKIAAEDSNSWCTTLVEKYQKRGTFTYCATYTVPDQLLG